MLPVEQIGTKPGLKSATWLLDAGAPSERHLMCYKVRGQCQVIRSTQVQAAIHKKVFASQKGLRSTGGPDLLKWGVPGGGIKSAKVAPTPYV